MCKFFVTTLLLGVAQIAKSDCNFGLYIFYPIAEGYCGFSTYDEDPFTGIMVECDDNGNAVMSYYDSIECSDDPTFSFNTTGVCNNTGSCNTVDFSTIGYADNMYCNGSNYTGAVSLTLASLDDECIGEGLGITANDDGLTIKFYNTDDCIPPAAFNGTITDGCFVDGNSSDSIYFFENIDIYTTTDSMESMESTDSTESADSSESMETTVADPNATIIIIVETTDDENSTTMGNETDSKSGGNSGDDQANGLLINVKLLIICLIISITNNIFA